MSRRSAQDAASPHTPGGASLTELVLETFRLNGRLLAVGNAQTGPLGQSSARWQVMGAIESEPRPVSDIARRMGLTRQSVQRTADRLAEDGLVAFRPNPHHRRAKLVELTRQGRKLLGIIHRGQTRWANELARRVPARDLKTAVRVVQTLREALEEENA